MRDWAWCRVELQMPREEWEQLTGAEVHSLREAWIDRQEREERGAGMIACMLYNCNRGTDSPVGKIEDFVPQRRKKMVTTEQQAEAEAADRKASQLAFIAAFKGVAEASKP